jgi:hypothetical protein
MFALCFVLLIFCGESGIECDLMWQKADVESQPVGIRRSLSPSRSSSPLNHNALTRPRATIMEKLQDQGLAGSDSHQQHAQSFLAFESRSKASEVMGWTARTPSPSGEPYYASGKSLFLRHPAATDLITSGDEIALTPRSHSGRAMILNTPLGSPPSAFVEPATPTSKHEPLNCFGLLTPKTPHFGDILVQPPVSPSDGDSSNGNRAIRLPSEKRQDATSERNDITSIGPATSDVAEQVLVDRTRDIAVQQEIRDAALAASMVQEVETPGKRRSNRLAVREVLKGEL